MEETQEEVPLKVKYESINQKGEVEYSKEYEINISLDPENFLTNNAKKKYLQLVKIIKQEKK